MDDLHDAGPLTSIDPFTASLTLSVKRRQLQNHTSRDLYARPHIRIRKDPPINSDTAPDITIPRRRPSVSYPYTPFEGRRPTYSAITPPYPPVPFLVDVPPLDNNNAYGSSSRPRSPRRPKSTPDQGRSATPSPTRSMAKISQDYTYEVIESSTPPRSQTRSASPSPQNLTPARSFANNVADNIIDAEQQISIRLPPPHELSYNLTLDEQNDESGWGWDPAPGPHSNDTEDRVEGPINGMKHHTPLRSATERTPDVVSNKDRTSLPPLSWGWEPPAHIISRRTSRKTPSPAHIAEGEKGPSSDPEALTWSHNATDIQTYITVFFLDTIPRQICLHCHLRLPYMYFSRINRIFLTAGLSVDDIKGGMLDRALKEKDYFEDYDPWGEDIVDNNTAYDRLQKTWSTLVDALIYEWTNLNIISALLLAAILTLLQIDTASTDPLPRYTAFSSMICALISLLCGYIYLVWFESMRNSCKIVEWANEIQNKTPGVWWNMWIFLALPATWLVWSVILFITCAMSLVWRNGTEADMNRSPMSPKQALAGRVIVTVLLVVGMVYLALVSLTLRRYGERMDKEWHRHLSGWVGDTPREVKSLNMPTRSISRSRSTRPTRRSSYI